MNAKIVIVKALLLFKQNGVLYFLELTRSPHKKFFPSMGDLPGGGVETGESPLAAIKREIQEETGLIVPTLHEVTIYNWGDNLECREYLYCAVVDTQEVTLAPDEHVSYRWLALDQIGQSALHPNVIKIIEREKNRIVKLVEKKGA